MKLKLVFCYLFLLLTSLFLTFPICMKYSRLEFSEYQRLLTIYRITFFHYLSWKLYQKMLKISYTFFYPNFSLFLCSGKHVPAYIFVGAWNIWRHCNDTFYFLLPINYVLITFNWLFRTSNFTKILHWLLCTINFFDSTQYDIAIDTLAS